MKELDSFTVERLEELARGEKSLGLAMANYEESKLLAAIALAAKRAEPVAWTSQRSLDTKNKIVAFTDDMSALDYGTANGWADIVELYTTPQLNYPEIPEGWIKFQEQKPIANQYISFVSRHGEYASGLVGEDEWVEMHDGTSFALDEIYIWLLLPPLPAAPEKTL
ncbi:hypothetical protein NUF50_001653 [Yersinia enterocolitica]|nr:hypothetical protein [Yersinia enterocolitica]